MIHGLAHLFDTLEEYLDADVDLKTLRSDTLPEIISNVLNNRLRSSVLRSLYSIQGSASIHSLANKLYDCGNFEADTVEDMQVTVYHVHIPKLVEAGLVVVDEDHTTVELSKPGEQYESVFTPIND